LSSGIKVVLFFITISALLGFTQVPIQYAEGAVSWNGFLKEVGFPMGQEIYEVSVDTVILDGDRLGPVLQLRCLEGDYFDSFIISEGDDTGFPDGSEVDVANSQLVRENDGSKVTLSRPIGIDLQAQYRDTPPHEAPFDIPLKVTILCLSPSSFQTVGGEWQATDTTALIIGYSVLNLYWIAPIGIGIGVGIYLVKRKIE